MALYRKVMALYRKVMALYRKIMALYRNVLICSENHTKLWNVLDAKIQFLNVKPVLGTVC